MNIVQKVPFLLCLLFVMVFSTCATCTVSGTKKSPETVQDNNIKDDAKNKEGLERYLVDINQYTTGGEVYHKKYYNLLISIAGEIAESSSLTVARKSVGFYYDRRSEDRNRLYLGIDIQSEENHPGEYATAALAILKNYLSDIIDTVMSYSSIFDEKEIIGLVIGWRWTGNGYTGQITIWINENDLSAFINDKMTMNELLQRSTVTDTSGKIIRLPL